MELKPRKCPGCGRGIRWGNEDARNGVLHCWECNATARKKAKTARDTRKRDGYHDAENPR